MKMWAEKFRSVLCEGGSGGEGVRLLRSLLNLPAKA